MSSNADESQTLCKDLETFHSCMIFAHKMTKNLVKNNRKKKFKKIFDAKRYVESASKFGLMENNQKMVNLLIDVLSPPYLLDRITDQFRWAMREMEYEMED